MDRTLVFGIILFLFGLMLGLSIPWESHSPVQETVLSISDSTHSIGSAVDNSTDVQLYSYNFTLYNHGNQEIYVEYAEPVFSEEFGKLLLSDDHRIYVNKSIIPESTVQISRDAEFNMTGLSKADIFQIETFTTEIEVNSMLTIPFP